jgi:hypothetical protein
MKRVTIKLADSHASLVADTMTLHGDRLYVYNGDVLVGVFAEAEVKAAYVTEQKTV